MGVDVGELEVDGLKLRNRSVFFIHARDFFFTIFYKLNLSPSISVERFEFELNVFLKKFKLNVLNFEMKVFKFKSNTLNFDMKVFKYELKNFES